MINDKKTIIEIPEINNKNELLTSNESLIIYKNLSKINDQDFSQSQLSSVSAVTSIYSPTENIELCKNTPPNSSSVPNFGNLHYDYSIDPMLDLQECKSVLIKQQPEILEAITGCETPNRYHIFGQYLTGQTKYLFKCKESSTFFMRMCLNSSSREFHMNVKHIASPLDFKEDFSKTFVDIYKPYKCTCCCQNRPEMQIILSDTKEPLGIIRQPFMCINPELEVFDKNGALKYYIKGKGYQFGLLCANKACGKCSEVCFNIYDSRNINSFTQSLGKIFKKKASFTELITSADSYSIIFPPCSDPNDKLLIIASGLMIDYLYFEGNTSR